MSVQTIHPVDKYAYFNFEITSEQVNLEGLRYGSGIITDTDGQEESMICYWKQFKGSNPRKMITVICDVAPYYNHRIYLRGVKSMRPHMGENVVMRLINKENKHA